MLRSRRSFEPRPSDNGPRQRNAIGIAAIVLAALAWLAWTGRARPAPTTPAPAPSPFVRLHR